MRKNALKNTFDYGKADPKSVVGKVIAEFPDAKKDMGRTMQLVAQAVEEANKKTREELEKEMSDFVFYEKKEVKRDKWELPGVEEGKVVTRFLPEPNGFPHMGHAKSGFLSFTLAKQYNGKFLLRFDDTNPEKEKQEYVDAIKEDAEWLGLKADGPETYASDLMVQFYDYAIQLITPGNAFICSCTQEQMKKNREEKTECLCRRRSEGQNLAFWQQMVEGAFKEGEAILRLKGDMASNNTVMRDPTLFRIILTPHYRHGEKYKAWPTYDFEVSIADSLEGVTHALRSKEYELRDELYYFILDKLGLRKPVVYDFSRLNIKGNALSKRLIKPFVDEKKVWGWDDPRLLTLKGLKRRGILPEAIRTFVLGFGLSKVESEPNIEALLKENAKLLEPQAEHYFLVEKPLRLMVKNSKETFAKIPLHPTDKGRGFRVLHAEKDFFLSRKDLDELDEGDVFRLKELYNVKLLEKNANAVIGEYAGRDLIDGTRKVQWVPAANAIKCEVLRVSELLEGDKFNPRSLVTEVGYCEPECAKLEESAIVQLERVGFARLDDKTRMRFILTSEL